MAAKTKPLTDKEIKAAKPKERDYKLFDGGGLFLLVAKTGGKLWRLKYRVDGKEKLLSLGAYPAVSLVEARRRREAHRAELAMGVDPAQKRKDRKAAIRLDEVRANNTFEQVARDRLAAVRDTISEVHYARTLNAFENDVFQFIGGKNMDEVTAPDIVAILQRMAGRGVMDSARKVFYSISKTFKWAVSHGRAARNPAADIDMAELLGPKNKRHYPTITDDEGIKALLHSIDNDTGHYTVKMALKFAPYVFVRPANIRFAEWKEVDLIAKQWVIPPDKMKTREPLIVPLACSVVELLQELKAFTGDSRYLFPSLRTKTAPLSDGALINAIRRMGYGTDQFTPHGFRAMFSTIAHERSPYSHEAIETQLAHSVGNSVSKAYNRAKYLPERVELMQWWADYLDGLKT